MANETEHSNFQTVAAYIAGTLVPAREALTVGRGYAVEQPADRESKAYKFKKAGTLTASTVNESAQATKSEYTETSVTITAVKNKVYTELSEEAEIFIGSSTVTTLLDKGARALGQKWDSDFMANFANFSVGVGTSGAAISTDALLLATFELDEADAIGARAFFLHTKQLYQIADEIKDANKPELGAAQNGLLARNANVSALRGTLFNIPVFASNLVSDDSTDFAGGLVSQYAIGNVLYNNGTPSVVITDDPEYGLKKIGISSFWAFGEIEDLAGVKIISGV